MSEQTTTTAELDALPEAFRFSREVNGPVADDASRVLLALTDGGHARPVTDELRWASVTAALALARPDAPAPVPADEDREALSDFLFTVYDHGTQPNALREADAILTFLAARSSQPAPSVSSKQQRKAAAVLSSFGVSYHELDLALIRVAAALGIEVTP